MGGNEITGAPVRRNLPDEFRAPPGVAAGAQSGRRGDGDGDVGGGGGRDSGVRGERDRNQGRDIRLRGLN